jgi:hypothetical protein
MCHGLFIKYSIMRGVYVMDCIAHIMDGLWDDVSDKKAAMYPV